MVEAGVARRVSIDQGVMTIEGFSERFVQGIARHLHLIANDLSLSRGFSIRAGRLEEAQLIRGRAVLAGDSLQQPLRAGEADDIALMIRPLSAGEDGRILLVLDVDEAEGAYAGGYRAEIHMAASVFGALKQDLLAGAAETLSLSATTSLWVRESQREAAAGVPVAWHFGVEPNGRGVIPARGLVETLEWRPAPPTVPPAEPALPPSIEVGALETIPDQLARIDWSLKQIALVLVFLLIVVALK
ncbi:hypothetical protein AE618_18270 [Bosea vaviloviae]|uniref:Uncharacterized protein n=2 Tax=Bosea vaviloviae TaxID=1526658 RepID=A0A0N1F3P1_9HYPH|nr:hypothetical protein AE618_18270 [Bosea vaviloviae]